MATSAGTLEFRRATPQDAEAFVQLMSEEAVYGGLLQLPYPSAESWRKRLEASAADDSSLSLVAARGGELVASGGVFRSAMTPRRRHAASLGLSVRADWQRRGVGSEMLRRLLEWSDGWIGYLRIELTVFTDNAAAIALYRKFGFAIEGTHGAYALRGGELVDAYAMARLHPRPPRPAPG